MELFRTITYISNKLKYKIMKKLLYLTSILLLFSCVSNSKKNEDIEIGYEILNSGEKASINAGDISTIEVWEKYVDAHNKKDLEIIKSLNHNDIEILTPGGKINTSEEHIKFLDRWFSENNPNWKTVYMIANELNENDTLKPVSYTHLTLPTMS